MTTYTTFTPKSQVIGYVAILPSYVLLSAYMTQKVPELSLFLPAYNEAGNIEATVSKADKVLRKVATKYEILVVNDGSRDDTGKIVKAMMKTNPNIRLIEHNPNRGYGGAFKSGLYGSKYALVSFIDSDGQFDYSEVDKLLAHINNYDLVIGYRLKRQDNFLRNLNAFIWKLWMWFLFGLWVKDIDCAFKVIKKDVIDKIKLDTESALTSAEFLIKVKHQGYKLKEVGVHHYPRLAGSSTGANIKVIVRAFKESFKLWFILNTS